VVWLSSLSEPKRGSRMPSVSQKQRRAMCLALSVKLGKRSSKNVSPEIRRLAKDMSVKDLSDFCHSKVEEK